ncbi:MAG: ribonuclease III [Oscillospiraceae bacterium]|nr:ribonuclease III [Oscillospiraceae bacterium]
MGDNNIKQLQEKLNYKFKKTKLLELALTHSSYANDNKMSTHVSNQRLEFLGDSVLGMIVAQLIYKNKPELTEGKMSKLRADLVCEKTLAGFARGFDLGSYLLLSFGESKNGGRERPSILADAFEAVIAAIYLDGGLKPAMKFVKGIFLPYIKNPIIHDSDYKTVFQEFIQPKTELSYTYETVAEEGPNHNKLFTVELRVNGETKGTGTGKSKKIAEQAAAKEALLNLKGDT